MRAVTRPPACVSDLVLDEWLAGELDSDRVREAAAHLEGCAQCRARRDALLAQRAAFLAAAPTFREHAARFGPARAARAPAAPRRRGPWFAAAGAALTLLLGIVLLRPGFGPGLEPPVTRSKGAPSLGFFVLRDDRVTRGASGATVYPGDRLRFTYSADRPRQLALFARDAVGATVFFPSGARSTQVRAGHDLALDFSVELDDQLGEESVHAVFCPEPFEPLRVALAQRGELPVSAQCTVFVIALNKVRRP